MTALVLTEPAYRAAKSNLRLDFPEVSSSHLGEAIAAALGFKTYAAFKALLYQISSEFDEFRLLNASSFASRLTELGYAMPSIDEVDLCFSEMENGTEVINTEPLSAYEIEYKSPRSRAWRNLMICAINEGLRQRLFSLRAGDNRWPGFNANDRQASRGFIYELKVEGMAAKAKVSDAGFGELSITIVISPNDKFVSVENSGFKRGEATAHGWVERENGAWLQSSETRFSCRRHLLPLLSKPVITPLGYGDRGRVIL